MKVPNCRICYINANGLITADNDRLREIAKYMLEHQIDIFGISETNLNTSNINTYQSITKKLRKHLKDKKATITNANTMASLARETAAATRARHARLLALVLAAGAMFDRGARGPAGGQGGRGDAGRHQVFEGRGGSMGAARRSLLVLVLAAAIVFGQVIEHTEQISNAIVPLLTAGFGEPGLIACVLTVMIAGGLMGVHPMATAPIMLGLLAGLPQVSDLALGIAVLCGWGLGNMVSISSMALATTAGMFAVPVERLVLGRNLLFVSVFAAVIVGILSLLGRATG